MAWTTPIFSVLSVVHIENANSKTVTDWPADRVGSLGALRLSRD